MQDDPFADLIPGNRQAPAQSGFPGVIQMRPKALTPLQAAQEQRAQEDQQFQRDSFARTQSRQDATDARMTRTEERQTRSDERAALAASRLPGDKEKELRDGADVASALLRAQTNFKPDYLGIGSGIENFVQGYSPFPVGTPGQRDWWADFRRTDNIERNALFGASLSGGEKAAYAATTITPDMTPEQAKINIDRRADIIRSGLKRYRNYLVKSGYNADAIDVLVGPTLGEGVADKREQSALPPIPGGTTQFGQDSRPPGSEEYTREVEAGVQNGTIRSANDLAAVATKYGYQPPDEREAQAVFDSIAKGARFGGALSPVYGSVQQVNAEMARDGRENEVVDPLVRGVADTAMLGLADEFSAAGQTLFGEGTMRENLARQRAIDTFDERNNPVPRISGQVAAGFALPTFGASTPGRLAALGGGYAAGYGFGSSDGSIADRLVSAGISAPLGAGGGYVGGRLLQSLDARSPNPQRQAAADVAQAARAEGIDMLPADVGGPFVRRMTAAAAQLPFSASSVVRGGQRTMRQSSEAAERAAASAGTALSPEDAGDIVLQGAQAFSGRTSKRGGDLYDRAATLAGDARVDPAQARSAVAAQVARLEAVPGGGVGLEDARKLLTDLEGNFTVQGIRDMRTEMFVKPEHRGTPVTARMKEIVNAAARDVEDNLRAQGKGDAADAFALADRYWRQRIETIDQTIAPIIGPAGRPKSGTEIMNALGTASRRDAAKLARFMQALPADEQATVRATVISQLGRATPGAQDASGQAFSLSTFLTRWNEMTPRAKDVMFRGAARDTLNNLAKVAEGGKQAAGYANRSNTGGAVGGLLTGGTLAIDTQTLGATAAAQFVTGQLLASPRFAQFLAKPPANREAAMRALSRIASSEPAIANDINRFAQSAFAASPGRAAASDDVNGGRPQVPQQRRP